MTEILETSEIAEFNSASFFSSSNNDLLDFEGVVAVVDYQKILETLSFREKSDRVGFGLQFHSPNSLEPVCEVAHEVFFLLETFWGILVITSLFCLGSLRCLLVEGSLFLSLELVRDLGFVSHFDDLDRFVVV